MRAQRQMSINELVLVDYIMEDSKFQRLFYWRSETFKNNDNVELLNEIETEIKTTNMDDQEKTGCSKYL